MRALLPAVLLVASTASAAPDPPPRPDRYATDHAGVIDVPRLAALNERLAQFERDTSNQVLVYVDRRLPADTTLEEFSNRAFNAWKVGQKDKDNGAVFFVFVDDRKMRIEVGYGLEGALPDVRAASIVEDYAKPRFRAGDFAGGVEAAADQIQRAARGEAYQGTGATHAESESLFSGGGPAPFLCWLPSLVALAIGALAARSRQGAERWRRGALVTGLVAVAASMLSTIVLQDGRAIAVGIAVLLTALAVVVWHVPNTQNLGGRRELGRQMLIGSGCAALLAFAVALFAAVFDTHVPYNGPACLLALAALPVSGYVYSREPVKMLTFTAGRLAALAFVPSTLFAVFFFAMGARELVPQFFDWIVPSGVIWLAATVFARSRGWAIWPSGSGGGGSYSRSGYSSGSSWSSGSSSSYSSSSSGSSFSGGGGSSGGGGASGSW